MKQRLNNVLCLAAISLVMLHTPGLAQIPNNGFETWVGDEPASWQTNNSAPLAVPVTKSSTAHSGSFALQGTILAVYTVPFSPLAITKTFPATTQYGALHGWYRATLSSGATFVVAVAFKNKAGVAVGGGTFTTTISQSSYKEFIANFFWAGTPDSAAISVQISGAAAAGSSFLLDDLSFGAAGTKVDEKSLAVPATFGLHQNYPNPFNASTEIKYDIPILSHVTLKVHSILGNEVLTLVDEECAAGSYSTRLNASSLASGTYFYRLQAGAFISTKKFVLLK